MALTPQQRARRMKLNMLMAASFASAKNVNLLTNSKLVGGVSGSPGTASTGWTYVNISSPPVVYAADSESNGGFTANVIVDTVQRLMWAQNFTATANTIYTFTVVVDVTSTLSCQNVFAFSTVPSGATAYTLLDGRQVTGSTSVGTGRHIVGSVLNVAATGGTVTMRFGCGVSSAGTAANITFSKPQLEIGTGRRNYVAT